MLSTQVEPLEYTPPAVSPTGPLTVALAGNPNCGKTTVFNALTGLRQKVANYPGVTVEKKTGRCWLPYVRPADQKPDAALDYAMSQAGRWIDIIDLPGTYSLISRSPDEQVAMEVLRGLRPDTKVPDVVVVVVDASNLQRNLYLVSQLIELGRPMVVALNMTDVAERRGVRIDIDVLSKELGLPVVPIVGHKRKGLEDLKAAVSRAAVAPLPAWPVPDAMREELLLVAGGLAILESETHPVGMSQTPTDELPAGDRGSADRRNDGTNPNPKRPLDRYEAIAERLLIGDHADDVRPLIDRPSIDKLLKGSMQRLSAAGIDPMQADIEAHYRWIDGVTARAMQNGQAAPADGDREPPVLHYSQPISTATEKVDAILIHKVWGLLIFVVVMAAVFVSLFWVADPIMGWTEGLVTDTGAWLTSGMNDGPLKSLITDGIFAGVGAVVVFVPQIAMLFFFLALLEDSGYLARAAFLMDKLLGKVGLSGKAFIPLLSSFACAIPGIMAARTIENRRDRLATIFVAPFMSCSARLPVYALLIGAFFAGYGALVKGGVMLACYALGLIAAVVTAWFFKRTFLKGPAQAFILELPSYKVPQITQVGRVVWSNTAKFLTKAGTIIFCLSVILWAMTYYPQLPEERIEAIRQQHTPTAKLQAVLDSVVARSSTDGGKTLTIRDLMITSSPFSIEGAQPDFSIAGEMELSIEGLDLAKMSDASPANTSDALPTSMQLTVNGQAVPQEEIERRTSELLDEDEQVQKQIAAAQAEHSISGRIGHFIEPVIRPLGYDWKMGVGLVAAFAAREVFVSSLGVVYSVGEIEDDDTALREHIMADTYADGSKVWTPLVAVSLLIWFVLAMQCMSTLAIVRRETNTWRWPIGMLVYMNALAYVVCLIVYQVGTRFWGA